MADRQRQAHRANFRGLNTRDPGDAMPEGKYPAAKNCRADGDSKIRTRPGYISAFTTSTDPDPAKRWITDIGSYASILTDGQPRVLAHNRAGEVYIDPGPNPAPADVGKGKKVAQVGTGGPGATITPFRPSASPQNWAYIANSSAYRKISAPEFSFTTLQEEVLDEKVGIAEPQKMPEAVVDGLWYTDFTGTFDEWLGSGPITGLPNNPTPGQGLKALVRSTNTVLRVFEDPASSMPPGAIDGPTKIRYSVAVGPTDQTPNDPVYGGNFGKPINYSTGQTVTVPKSGGETLDAVVEDVFPAINVAGGIEIASIYYFPWQTGHLQLCVIVPTQVGLGALVVGQVTNEPATAAQGSAPSIVANLRRGSVIQLGGEMVFVENVTTGPSGQLSIECFTDSNLNNGNFHQKGEPITGVLALALSSSIPIVTGQILANQINLAIDHDGLISIIREFPKDGNGNYINPFTTPLGPPPPGKPIGVPQENDLFHISMSILGAIDKVVQIKISFDIDDGTFLKNTLFYPISANQLAKSLSAIDMLGNPVDANGNVITDANQSAPVPQSQFTISTLLQQEQVVYNAIYQAIANSGNNPTTWLNPVNAISINPGTSEVQIVRSDGKLLTLNVPLATGYEQYTEFTTTLGSFLRTGTDHVKNFANATKMEISIIYTGPLQMGFAFGSIWVGGGGQPDTGGAPGAPSGSPYYYRVVPRDSRTGAFGNPSPATRYGVTPRVQPVFVTLPDVLVDPQTGKPQHDKWDIYRYGGTVTSYRYIGTAGVTDMVFRDNVFDSAALGGSLIEFDNFEPWPTVDTPFAITPPFQGAPGLQGATETEVMGTVITMRGAYFTWPHAQGPGDDIHQNTIARWLPGTLITVNGQQTYTLWNRPVVLADDGNGAGFALRILEAAIPITDATITVNEPILAAQTMPYVWGPDANGVFFACGDPFRPGTFQPSKPFNPDAAPNNVYDLVSPSEPLLGGQIVDGLSVVASSERWWMLQPSQDPAKQWNPVETPAGRGLAAPYGHCTDGARIYYWAHDSIRAMVPGAPAQDLTSADLGNIFPQGGVRIGVDVPYPADNPTDNLHLATTVYAPDYRLAAFFRLEINNWILRAHYYDRQSFARTLILDMTPTANGQPRMAWSVDEYADPMTCSLNSIEPPAQLASVGPIAYNEGYLADANGKVWIECDFSNDNTTPITGRLATPEANAGDSRTTKSYMDAYLDMVNPGGGATVEPVVNGQLVGVPESVTASNVRKLQLYSLQEMTANQLGFVFTWTDDFGPNTCGDNPLTQPTTLYEWGEEWVTQPLEIKTWQSLWTNCGLDGYLFIYRIRLAYTGGPVTLNIGAYDGIAPAPITLPATPPGQYVKQEFVPTANKALLFQFTATGDWSPNLEDSEIVVCQWGRTGFCSKCNGLGGNANA